MTPKAAHTEIHSASYQNSFSQIHCQTHAWFPYNYKSRSCFASLLHQPRNVPGRRSPQRIEMKACLVSPDPLGDKVIFLTRQLKSCLSLCQLIQQQQRDKCILTWLLFPGAQSVLLLTEKVASIIEHTADTAPLMLNSKTMRSWSALPADMRSTDAFSSFLNDRIFNEGTGSEI